MFENYDFFSLDDEEIISLLLKPVIVNGDSWPGNFIQDLDVFIEDPRYLFDSDIPVFVVVKPRTEACGKTDGCESGCWRIIGRDKLIKSKETGKFLGFKKIFKFCVKRKPREYKRCYVMEEYRLTNNLNWKQDHVLCKIRFQFQAGISSLLEKHFHSISESLPAYDELLPDYGYFLRGREQDESYLRTIMNFGSGRKDWPSYVTNKVYSLNPLMLVDPLDQMFQKCGICIFANETLGTGDICDVGYWRNMDPDTLVKSEAGETLGFIKHFMFIDTEDMGEDAFGTWTMKEYRLKEQEMQNKRLCIIEFLKID